MGLGDWPGWAALILAIVSPIITTLYNGHKSKQERIEAEQNNMKFKKMSVLDEYLIKASNYIANIEAQNSSEFRTEYYAAHFKTIMYSSPETIHAMESLFQYLSKATEINQEDAFMTLGIISTLFIVYDQPINEISSIKQKENFVRELKTRSNKSNYPDKNCEK